MYLQLAENNYLGRKSKSQRQEHRQQTRSKIKSKFESLSPAHKDRIKKAYYVPQVRNGQLIHVREDLFDNLPEQEYDERMSEAEYLEENFLSDGEYLSGKAERQAKKSERKARKDQRKDQKAQGRELKNQKKAAKVDVISSKADLKRGKAAAASRGEKTSNWLDDLTGVADAVGGVVGAFKGDSSSPIEATEEPGSIDPSTGEVINRGQIGAGVAKKSMLPYYIGGGLLVAVVLGVVLMKKKK
jgi:hypothetical protein